eukprot:1137855-Pelagomonas_calceolata.AAC.2
MTVHTLNTAFTLAGCSTHKSFTPEKLALPLKMASSTEIVYSCEGALTHGDYRIRDNDTHLRSCCHPW